jgi:hypothetical protein
MALARRRSSLPPLMIACVSGFILIMLLLFSAWVDVAR